MTNSGLYKIKKVVQDRFKVYLRTYLDEEKLLINGQNQEESIYFRRKNVFDNISVILVSGLNNK